MDKLHGAERAIVFLGLAGATAVVIAIAHFICFVAVPPQTDNEMTMAILMLTAVSLCDLAMALLFVLFYKGESPPKKKGAVFVTALVSLVKPRQRLSEFRRIEPV